MAAHVAAERSKFNCKTCRWGRHCDDSNPAKLQGWFSIPGVLESRTCFLPMITADSNRMLRLHWHYRKGFLPYRGGIADQPNLYIEAMEILEKTFGEIEAAIAERDQRRAES